MKILTAILSVVQDEISSIKNLFGYLLTAISLNTVDLQSYLSIGIMTLTLIWWAIRIYKQIFKDGNSNK